MECKMPCLSKDIGEPVHIFTSIRLKKNLRWLEQGRYKIIDNSNIDDGKEDPGAEVFYGPCIV